MVQRIFSQFTTSGASLEYRLDIPSIVDPTYWKRHQLTFQDITTLTTTVPSWYLWTSAMLYGKVNTWASLRISFSDPYSTIVNNKLSAIKYMLSSIHYKPLSLPHRINISSQTHFGHSPPLPMYYISSTRFQVLLRNLVPVLLPHRFLSTERPPTAPFVETFMGQRWIPHRIEGNCISLLAVGSQDKDMLHTDTLLPLSRQSLRCTIGTTPVLLTDEVIWVSPET